MNEKYARYLIQKVHQNYNQIADRFSRERKKPWLEAKFLVDDYLKTQEKILDFGCGAGQWFEFFKEKRVDYYGVDFSEKLIEIAKKRHPEGKFFVADLFNLPFPDNFFDKIYSIAVFHHLPSIGFRLKVLNEIKRVIKKGGMLIISVWNLWKHSYAKKLIFKFGFLKIFGKTKLDFGDILMNWKGIKNCYFHAFTKKELKDLIKSAPFDIIKIGEFFVQNKNSNYYIIAKNLKCLHSSMERTEASGASNAGSTPAGDKVF